MSSEMIWMLFDSFVDTCIMVGISGLLGSLFGIPLGVLLYATSAKGIAPMPISNQVVGWIVNAVRSTPFIILMVAIIPLTRFIAGTSIGTAAAIVPLTIAVTPLIARLVETSLREVDPGLVEAALAMGATDYQIISKVLLPEALPGIVAGLTISFISLISASAMAGAIGAGGLGNFAIMYGHQRNMPDITYTTVVVLVIIVTVVQLIGNYIAKKNTH